ncbi:putative cell cycle control protein [Phaeomoniella chlamydospora]|uniref:Putative cell cycle control protein n=1 Tax=Phaeomoniella chlamydospora TaxID=158046 RepID=A0A0G2E7D4_PHACM|nr:putative cell cycle control protein [Phaeomoniella chlamydospora]
MAPQDDLKAHATSSVDFYELLSIESTASDSEIRRAYRKTSLKYHPDKVGASPENLEKFHLLQIANDVLSDPAIRTLYDQSREARERRKREHALLEGRRKQMKDDLERRESGAFGAGTKRSWDTTFRGGESAEAKLEREVQRIAEENRRKREQMNEDMRRREREALEAEEQREKENEIQVDKSEPLIKNGYGVGGQSVPEIERTIKVRWTRGGIADTIDKEILLAMFKTFGVVDNAFLLKDKKQRTGENKEKKLIATGIIVFKSIVGAHAAVTDVPKQSGEYWDILDSVCWANEREPETLSQQPQSPKQTTKPDVPPSTPSSPSKARTAFLAGLQGSAPSTPIKVQGNGLRKVPSFTSFSSAAFATPRTSPAAQSTLGPNSPSFEELTMIKLKNAQRELERKKLEEQIRIEEEATDKDQ